MQHICMCWGDYSFQCDVVSALVCEKTVSLPQETCETSDMGTKQVTLGNLRLTELSYCVLESQHSFLPLFPNYCSAQFSNKACGPEQRAVNNVRKLLIATNLSSSHRAGIMLSCCKSEPVLPTVCLLQCHRSTAAINWPSGSCNGSCLSVSLKLMDRE